MRSRRLIVNASAILLIVTVAMIDAHAQVFTKITGVPIVMDGKGSRSANFVDYDNDGFQDIFVSNGKSGGENNMLYHNNGDGTFTQVTTGPIVNDGKPSDGASFADYNNDGLIDAAVANWFNQGTLLYRSDSLGYFGQVLGQIPPGGYSEACSWADYDLDGDVDLFVANSAGSLLNYLFRNNGNGTFTKITSGPVVTDAHVSRLGLWADFDGDLDPDLYVTNEGSQNNDYYINQGGGVFVKNTTDEAAIGGGDSWGASAGDIDNDGDLDLFVVNASYQNDQMFINDGSGNFTRRLTGAEISDLQPGIGSAFVDYDNDGDLDLFVANGYDQFGANLQNKLYENDGTGVFTSVSAGDVTSDLGWTYGCAWGDYDNDGDVDLMTARWKSETENNILYRNDQSSTNHSVMFTCVGIVSNNSAIGARIRAFATIGGNPVWQMCEIGSVSGYAGQNSLPVEFGLGDATVADSVIAIWPSGIVDTILNVDADEFYTLYEGSVSLCQGADSDRDGAVNPGEGTAGCPEDNCPNTHNSDQSDADSDGIGDVCDACPNDQDNDADSDSFCADIDNCPVIANPGQEDTNNDGIGDACCCVNLRGNVDGSGDDVINIADLTKLVGFMFKGGATPPCPNETDINGDATVNITDLTYLVAFMFKGGSGPAPC